MCIGAVYLLPEMLRHSLRQPGHHLHGVLPLDEARVGARPRPRPHTTGKRRVDAEAQAAVLA
jgi:hypothetical protein